MTADRPGGDTRPDVRTEQRGHARPDHRIAVRLGVTGVLALAVVAGAGTMGLHHLDTVRAERELFAAEAARAATQQLAEEEAEAERIAAREASQEAAARTSARLAAAVEAVLAEVAEVLPPAQVTLTESEGKVPDEAVRTALAHAIESLDGTLEAADVRPAVVRRAMAEVTTAQAAVVEARTAWETAEAARIAAEEAQTAEEAQVAESAEAAPAPPAAPPERSGGAGPDCGGPASYEPPGGTATFFTSTPDEDGDGSNGRLPRSQMTALGWCVDSRGNAQWLRSDAAAALTRLNEAFRARFGENIAVDMSYRSYTDQVAMREHYGSIAARPGTSNHGWGTAFDTWEWAAYSFGSERYEWLVENGPAHGWVAPGWARTGGSNPEYWHFEYVG